MTPLPVPEPDGRPLGAIAVGLSTLALLCALTGFLSPLTVLLAGLGLPLGLVCRGQERTRRLGNVAIGLSSVAVPLAVATFLMVIDAF